MTMVASLTEAEARVGVQTSSAAVARTAATWRRLDQRFRRLDGDGPGVSESPFGGTGGQPPSG